ncbi:MAG: nitroreductase family protein [Planctomycetota bacterium]|jgi:nitroreductase|nr:nitroreductase family protein [Planctomycetota bacterium]
MDFFETIRGRRSCREFLDRPVSAKDIETCLEAARLAPSGTNAQPWRFLVARRPGIRAALAEAGHGHSGLKQAPAIVALLGDRGLYRKRLRRAKELADIGALRPETLAALESRYLEKEKNAAGSRDAGLEDRAIQANCMLAGEHFVLAAAALELGCCWVGAFEADKVAEILKLNPKYNFPVALLALGYPADGSQPPRPRYSISDIAWKDEAGRPWEAGTA